MYSSFSDILFLSMQVFYYKMKGDYHRYLAEFEKENLKKTASDLSMGAYQAATGT